jgi:hypothetical protein
MSAIRLPPGAPDDRRGQPRIELYALLDVKASGEVLIVTVRNLSLSGALVEDDGTDLTRLPIGTRHELALFVPGDSENQLALIGEVVRHEPGGMALRWTEDAMVVRTRIAALRQNAMHTS